ncbi:hypothetical protein [Lacicoccus qingdaonensis]|uniref:Uncharacterized protein n=1 Tax=Lacicoccus qingdaonensis TaxID=576118 RepID=A0A1G9GW41_9BACL|nr:hypothetical protein [Salinicoccus qingdaonensis]SDL04920.1 hypothetical protein SAMN05216216_11933 [Salinicoccus qingdaonensis]
MKLLLLLITTPLFLISCLSTITGNNPNDLETTENDTEEVEEPEDTEEMEEETEPPEVEPVNITSDAFISNFFSASYEYRTISIGSSYDYMVNALGEPEGSGELTDGTYYHYEHIAFNFPESADDTDTSELRADGIIIFPEEFSKMDAVENYGWPTVDDTSNFRMMYDSDPDNGYYVMMTYDQQDYIQEIMLHSENFEDTSLSEDD